MFSKVLKWIQNKIKWQKYNMHDRYRNWYLRLKRRRLKVSKVCLISSNCIGGCILHDMGLQFSSPFVNLLIRPKDYIRMLKDLPRYMAEELIFIKEEGKDYPVARLGDIKVYFVHYSSEEEARAKWVERTARMDYEHLYVLFTNRDGVTEQDMKEFDELPYKHKAILVNRPTPEIRSAVYIKGYEKEKELGMLIAFKGDWSFKMRYDDFDYVSWLNAKI